MKENPTTADDDAIAENIHLFSEVVARAIREVFAAGAVHPAAIVGVLNYHAIAVASSTRPAFVKPMGSVIAMPPPGFNPKP